MSFAIENRKQINTPAGTVRVGDLLDLGNDNRMRVTGFQQNTIASGAWLDEVMIVGNAWITIFGEEGEAPQHERYAKLSSVDAIL